MGIPEIFYNFHKNPIMVTRDSILISMRPEIPSVKTLPNTSSDERFQNQTLRPVVRLQNELLLASFRNYVAKHKNVFYDLSLEKRLEYIEHAIQKDIKYRNSLKGIIIGQFTLDEFDEYIQNSSALNKRMMDIVIERIKSNIQLLEYQCA